MYLYYLGAAKYRVEFQVVNHETSLEILIKEMELAEIYFFAN